MTLGKVLDRCVSFEWRGPYQSLSRVDGDQHVVLRAETDWSAVVGSKPVVDLRSAQLADVFPKSKALLNDVLSGALSRSASKSSGPKFG